jgi:hypothetical protein
LFNRTNIWRISKPPSWLWLAFKSFRRSPEKSVIQQEQGVELTGFEKLFAYSTAFQTEGLRIYQLNVKLKRQLKKL